MQLIASQVTALSSTLLVNLAEGGYTASQMLWNDTRYVLPLTGEPLLEERYFDYFKHR